MTDTHRAGGRTGGGGSGPPDQAAASPTIVNTDQATAWNGAEGSNWARHHRRTTGINAPLGTVLIEAAEIAETDRVLDVGCGSGSSTLLAAAAARRGTVVGVDLSAVLLDSARADAAARGLRHVRFEQADAQVHPFPAGWFDVVISQFGVMFFADPVAAFANLARSLRADGRMVFVCPRKASANAWWTVPMGALLGTDTGADEPTSGMFSLGDAGRAGDILTAAGFVDVALDAVDLPLNFGPDLDTALDFFVGSGPVRAIVESNPALAEDVVRRRLAAALAPHHEAEGVQLAGAFWLVRARRP
ncbi:MAG: methyltransferase domain-containing protein [Frankia sp.]|nr:methyltransferase domain-containing protein [Frankia sp.]